VTHYLIQYLITNLQKILLTDNRKAFKRKTETTNLHWTCNMCDKRCASMQIGSLPQSNKPKNPTSRHNVTLTDKMRKFISGNHLG